VARQTRSQRRARREAQAQSAQAGAGGGVAERARRQQQLRTQQQARSQAGAQPRRERGARAFIGESWAELKKVDWPGQAQVIQATVVVLIACAVVGVFLYLADLAWKPAVQWIIGS
jgi:preprotein translocase subunit SecE